jgi:hypothetical protein
MRLSLAWETPLYRNSKVRPITCLILIRNSLLTLLRPFDPALTDSEFKVWNFGDFLFEYNQDDIIGDEGISIVI